MKGFDANVPKKKPRTRLGSMLAELDEPATEVAEEAPAAPAPRAKAKAPVVEDELEAQAETIPPTAEVSLAPAPVDEAPPTPQPESKPTPTASAAAEPAVVPAPKAVARAPRPEPAVVAEAPAARPETKPAPTARAAAPAAKAPEAPRPKAAIEPPRAATPARPRSPTPAGEVVEAGRARLDALRRRLAAADLARQPAAAPEATASRVRETVGHLKQRLDEVLGERKGLLDDLERSRAEVANLQQQLEREQKARAAAETQAEERGRVAEELMAESEALADERDQALARIAEIQNLNVEQLRLLDEMEGNLAERDAALVAAHGDAEVLRHNLEAIQTDLALTQTELDEARDARRSLERRTEELEAQLARAEAAKAALTEIQRLVDGVG